MKQWVVIGCFCWIPMFTMAQKRPEIDLQDFSEGLFQVQDNDINYDELYESLFLYYTNPLDLNKATPEELGSLYVLSPAQINSFFNYRERRGLLLSLYELQAIPEFDVNTIRKLLPFVGLDERTDNRPLFTRLYTEENNYFLLRYSRIVPKSEGYRRVDGSGYLGDPNTLYGRFRVSHSNDFSLGITFEKDAGEQWKLSPANQQYGFDYYSYHFFLQNKGKLKTLALGDYQLQIGQGVVFGAGFSAGKGAETINTVKRNSVGVRPYASVLESGFFRGAALTVQLGATKITAFGSRILQDASLQNDTSYSNFEEFVNSIQATGYHRTSNELAAKNTTAEISTGMILEQDFGRHLSIGLDGLFSHYSSPLQKRPNNYNQYEFTGQQNYVSSLYFNYTWQNLMLFGETAFSKSGGNGTVIGLLASLTSQIDMSWLYRNYDKNFHSFYGNAFSESSRNINERGVYWGISYQPSRKYRFAAYFDKFTFPWLKYRVDAPSQGFEYLSRFTYKPARGIQLYAQFRQENKELSIPVETSNLSQLTLTIKRNYIFNIDYAVGRTFSFKSRIQGSTYHKGNEQSSGTALIQDINLAFWKMKLSTRFALFDTDNYDNRQYVYEKNVLYTFGIPAYYGAGTRSYFMLQYRISRSLTCWLRYSIFDYSNQNSVGSGLDQIQGNKKSEVKLMLRYQFRKPKRNNGHTPQR